MATIAEDVLWLSEAIPVDDRTIAHRLLVEMVTAAHDRGERIIDRAAFLDRARVRSAAALEKDGAGGRIEETAAPAWKSRVKTTDKRLAARAAHILEALRASEIEPTRSALFGAVTPPCATLADAEDWIVAHTDKSGPPTDEPFEYYAGDGSSAVRRVRRDAEHRRPAYWLQRWAERMKNATAIPTRSLIAYMLTGLLPGTSVRLRNGRRAVMPGLSLSTMSVRRLPLHPARHRIRIELDVADLTDQNLRVVRQDAYRNFGLAATSHRSATSKQRKIADIVAALGGPPRVKYDKTFWREVHRRLRGRGPDDPIALARAFDRARTRSVI